MAEEFKDRPQSGMAHAENPTEVVTALDGHAAFWPIRFPRDLAFVAGMAASDVIASTRLVPKKYRPGESGSVERWYFRQAKPHLDRLKELHDEAWK